MDTFAKSTTRIIPEDEIPGSLLAYDVILISATYQGLQAVLDTATESSHTMDMTWRIKKCHALDGPFLE